MLITLPKVRAYPMGTSKLRVLVCAADAGKRIGQVRARGVVVEAEIQIVSRAARSALAAAVAGAAQGLIQTDVQVVAVVERRCHKMKIRRVSGRLPLRWAAG